MLTAKTGLMIGAACVAACAAPAGVIWIAAGATVTGLLAALQGELGMAVAILGAGGGVWWGLSRRQAAKATDCCAGGVRCRLPEPFAETGPTRDGGAG